MRDPVPIPVLPEPPPDHFDIPFNQWSGTKPMEQEVIDPPATQLPAATGAGCWSARHKPSKRLQESIEQGLLSLHSVLDNVEGDAKYRIQQDPIAFAASNDPDTMYVDQALKEPDRKEFIKAMEAR